MPIRALRQEREKLQLLQHQALRKNEKVKHQKHICLCLFCFCGCVRMQEQKALVFARFSSPSGFVPEGLQASSLVCPAGLQAHPLGVVYARSAARGGDRPCRAGNRLRQGQPPAARFLSVCCTAPIIAINIVIQFHRRQDGD